MKKFTAIWLIFLCFLSTSITYNEGASSENKRCGNSECSVPISRAKTLVRYNAPKKDGISFKKGVEVEVFSKLDMYWSVKVGNKIGFAPASFLKETKLLVPSEKLIVVSEYVATEPVKVETTQKDSEEVAMEKTSEIPAGVGSLLSFPSMAAAQNVDGQGSLPTPSSPQYEVVDGTTIFLDPVYTTEGNQQATPPATTKADDMVSAPEAGVSDPIPSSLPSSETITDPAAESSSEAPESSNEANEQPGAEDPVTPTPFDNFVTPPALAEAPLDSPQEAPEFSTVAPVEVPQEASFESTTTGTSSETTTSTEPAQSPEETKDAQGIEPTQPGLMSNIYNTLFSSGDGTEGNSQEDERDGEEGEEEEEEDGEVSEDDEGSTEEGSTEEGSISTTEIPVTERPYGDEQTTSTPVNVEDMMASVVVENVAQTPPASDDLASSFPQTQVDPLEERERIPRQADAASSEGTGAGMEQSSGEHIPQPSPKLNEGGQEQLLQSDEINGNSQEQTEKVEEPVPVQQQGESPEVLQGEVQMPVDVEAQNQEEGLKHEEEEDMKRQQEEQLKLQQEEELKRQEEEKIKLQQEEESKRQEEEKIKLQQEEEQRLLHEQQLKNQQEEELKQQEEEQKRQQEEELKRQEEEALRLQQEKEKKIMEEEAQKRLQAELEEKRLQEEEQRRQLEEEAKRREEENRKSYEEEQQLWLKNQELQRIREEEMKKEKEEAKRLQDAREKEKEQAQIVEEAKQTAPEEEPDNFKEQEESSQEEEITSGGMFTWFSGLFGGTADPDSKEPEEAVPMEQASPQDQNETDQVLPTNPTSPTHQHIHPPVWSSEQQTMCSASEADCEMKTEPEEELQAGFLVLGIQAPSLDVILLRFAATAVALFMGALSFYLLRKKHVDSGLVARINELEKELLVASKEAIILREEVSTTNADVTSEEIITLREELESCRVVRADLEEQVATLERELEEATETGIELNKLLSETLEATKGKAHAGLAASVERLQQQLNGQKDKVDSLTRSLKVTSAENENLKALVTEGKEKISALEAELAAAAEIANNIRREREEANVQATQELQQVQAKLEEALSSKVLEESRLGSELSAWKLKHETLRSSLSMKDAEVKTLQETLKQLESGNGNMEQLLDVSKVKAELEHVTKERDSLNEKCQEEEKARKDTKDRLERSEETLKKLEEKMMVAERNKEEAETRLAVLSNYFKEKEEQLQKELGLKEAILAQHQGDESTVVKHLQLLQEEVNTYKAQNESLKKEIIDQERDFKGQIALLEKKAHDNWMTARQAERRLEDSRQEAAQLRNRLTFVEKNNADPNTRLDANGEGGVASPLMMMPPPPLGDMETPPPLPPFMFSPPPPFMPPPFMPPPLQPHPMGRPPPLGRMSSPPPPLGQFSPPLPPYDRLDRSSRSPSPPPHRYHHRSPPPPEQWIAPPVGSSFRPVPKPSPKKPSESRDHKGSLHSSGHSNETIEKSRENV